MKDIVHHLQHVQRRIIRDSRKNEEVVLATTNGHKNETAEFKSKPQKKFDPNHRTPRISKRVAFH